MRAAAARAVFNTISPLSPCPLSSSSLACKQATAAPSWRARTGARACRSAVRFSEWAAREGCGRLHGRVLVCMRAASTARAVFNTFSPLSPCPLSSSSLACKQATAAPSWRARTGARACRSAVSFRAARVGGGLEGGGGRLHGARVGVFFEGGGLRAPHTRSPPLPPPLLPLSLLSGRDGGKFGERRAAAVAAYGRVLGSFFRAAAGALVYSTSSCARAYLLPPQARRGRRTCPRTPSSRRGPWAPSAGAATASSPTARARACRFFQPPALSPSISATSARKAARSL